MSKKASQFQEKIMSRMYRGKGALHPAETGRLTDDVWCVREYDVDIFFIRKGDTVIAIDAGYKSHPGLLSGCRALGIEPGEVTALFLTHADPDHTGANGEFERYYMHPGISIETEISYLLP